jgi:amidase
MSELWQQSATELARTIASGAASSREVVEAHLARIEAVNPHLNAVVRVLADEARAGAAEADRHQAAGGPLGPLHGVPFTVKENIDLAGTPTTQAVPFLAEAIASTDAVIVERMRAAGAIPIGRTNLPDFGLRIHTDSSLHGLTRNPWHQGHTVAGSSGGEASALASGMSPIGLGNDIGGSLRNPAHCCGIASIKPTTGRVPSTTVIDPQDLGISFQLMATDGPMARTVADVALGLSIISGVHPRDPMTVPVSLDHGPTTALRVAVMPEPPGGTTAPAVAQAVRAAAAALEAAGHQITEATPPSYEAVVDTWQTFLLNDMEPLRPLLLAVMGTDAVAFLEATSESRPAASLEQHVTALITRRALLRSWAEFYERYDVVLGPVWTEQAFPHGTDLAGNGRTGAEAAAYVLNLARPVLPANLFGLPAAVVPTGTFGGLPIGVQLTAWQFCDRTALAAAAAIEAALGIITPIDPVLG